MHILLFAFLFTEAFAQITLRTPASGQVLYPGRLVRIEWESSISQPVELSFSTDQGLHWRHLASVVGSNGFEWIVPELDTVSLLLRAQLVAVSVPQMFAQSTLQTRCEHALWLLPQKAIVTAGEDKFCVALPESADAVRCFTFQNKEVAAVCHYPGRQQGRLVVATSDALVVVNLESESIEAMISTGGGRIRSLAAHPSLPIVAAGCADGYVRLWNLLEGQQIGQVLSQALGGVDAVAFDPEGRLLAHGGADAVIIVEPWDNLGSSTERVYLLGHSFRKSLSQGVVALTFSPQGKYLLSTEADSTLMVWDYANWRAQHSFEMLSSVQRAITFSGDGSRVLAGGADGVVRQWSLPSGQAVHEPLELGAGIVALEWQPFTDTFFVATAQGQLQWWRLSRTTLAEDTTSVVVRYPFGLVLGSCRGKVGDTVLLPILLDRRYDVPYFQRATFMAQCTVILPPSVALVGDRTQYATHPRMSLYDTLTVHLNFGSGDTLGILPLQLLASSRQYDVVRVVVPAGLRWERSVSAFVLEYVDDGEIVVDTLCPVQGYRVPVFTEIEEMYVAPNPATEEAELVFSAVEAGVYTIELQSSARGDAAVLAQLECQRGRQRVRFRVDSFASGAYRVVVRGPSVINTVNLLVIR